MIPAPFLPLSLTRPGDRAHASQVQLGPTWAEQGGQNPQATEKLSKRTGSKKTLNTNTFVTPKQRKKQCREG